MSNDVERSDLIDTSYSDLNDQLSKPTYRAQPNQVLDSLKLRQSQLGDISNVFGKPSDTSRKKVESGSVTLADGVEIRVGEVDKSYVFAISKRYEINEVQALILMRSFFYNAGMPDVSDSEQAAVELAEAIGGFYFRERLDSVRMLIPLLRAKENESSPFNKISVEFISQIIPDGPKFAQQILDDYLEKTKAPLPERHRENPQAATTWAKQNLKEQLVLLEVLFWTMWAFVPCTGPLVVSIFSAAYGTNLGSVQMNNNLLLDEESRHTIEDCAALWILLTIEILELEDLSLPNAIEISDTPSSHDVYHSSPASLEKLHDIVTTHQGSQYSVTFLAWTYVISRLAAKAEKLTEIPPPFSRFLGILNPPLNRSYSKDREPLHVQMAKACLEPEVGLFKVLQHLLTQSPFFMTAVAWKQASSITDPNALAYRSVIKGLIVALVELQPVELLPDFEGFVEIWIALFGRSESESVEAICSQFWQADWHHGIARRAIFDVARSRFPVQVKPLIRLLRAMTGSGFLDTDPLYVPNSVHGTLTEERNTCDRLVYHYFLQLSSYTQVVPISACSGPHALYEKQTERFGGSSSGAILIYHNLRPIRLPGGSILPAKTYGRLLSSDGGEQVVVCWQHQHSGWKVILEILTEFLNRRRTDFGSSHTVSFAPRGGVQPKSLRIEDIGMELDSDDEGTITEALDLLRSVIKDNSPLTAILMRELEDNEPVVCHTMTESPPPDLVQLITMILEDALSRWTRPASLQSSPRTKLIASAMAVLSALLSIPSSASRVWLYIRNTSSLFGGKVADGRTPGFASIALAAERATGQYTMTLALLHLVESLFKEAYTTILPPGKTNLKHVKEEVMLRAMRFVHTDIWVEHLSWKYLQLGDRFEIGRIVSGLYIEVLIHSPPTGRASDVESRPFPLLSQAVADVLLFKATTSTINPIVSTISTGEQVFRMLWTSSSRRQGDTSQLILLLQSNLRLCRMILTSKSNSIIANRPCLLEQALSARVVGSPTQKDGFDAKRDTIDILASYIKNREIGPDISVEATRVLCALLSSLTTSQSSLPTIVGHLSNPEATVASLIRIIQHPYDDLALRKAVWNFVALAVDKEPALARLLVSGKTGVPSDLKDVKNGKAKGKQETKPKEDEKSETDILGYKNNALDAACDILVNWNDIWEANPLILSCVLRFLDVVWQHALEHKSALEPLQNNGEFWERIVGMASQEVGPVPEYSPSEVVIVDGLRRSTLHDGVQAHAYRNLVKAHAIHIITLDIGMFLQSHRTEVPPKPESYLMLEPFLKSQDQLTDCLAEASSSSYAPHIHDEIASLLEKHFKELTLSQLEVQDAISEREYGDSFAFVPRLLRIRLDAYRLGLDNFLGPTEDVEKLMLSMNLNISLAHSEIALVEAWNALLRQVIPYLRTNASVRTYIMSIAASISYDIAAETRQGDMMSTIHGARLSLVLVLLEVAWFLPSDKKPDLESFMELTRNLRGIVLNEGQSPARSLLSQLPNPFHRTLLQILFFFAKQARSLFNRQNVLNAEQRLTICATVEAVLTFVIDGLRIVFVSARSRADTDLDRDMELFVAVFEQCTRPDLTMSSSLWLARCQETDIIRASLDLYVHIDIVGLSDLPLLLSRKQPLYAPHILLFHMALASSPIASERLASEGVLSAYSNTQISSVIRSGRVDIALAEFPGHRSPAHMAYCSMLAIVAMVITALGRLNHYFDDEACGFVQLNGDQISRALSWTIGDAITLPLLEEIDQVVNLFYSIAVSVPSAAKSNAVVEKVLRVFTAHALHLLQQVNYAITHPNHLASLYEPVTHEERAKYEKAQQTYSDPMKRPIVLHLIHRLFQLSSNIIGTLIVISKVDTVLSHGVDDWPVQEALVVPHSKVVLGEPASLGTLLELGNRTLDVLKNLVSRTPDQSITDASLPGSYTTPPRVKEGVITARRNLEEILLYAITQLAMWLSKPDFEGGVGVVNMDTEEDGPSHGHGPGGSLMAMDISGRLDAGKDKRTAAGASVGVAPRLPGSVTLAERLRRQGLTAEIAGDLQALLTKSKPVITASDKIIGKPGVDLTQILLIFLHEHVGGSS